MIRTAIYGLTVDEVHLVSKEGISTRSGSSLYFVDVLSRDSRSFIPSLGYWSLLEAIGCAPLNILVPNQRKAFLRDLVVYPNPNAI